MAGSANALIGRVIGALFIVLSVLPLMEAIVTTMEMYRDYQVGRPIGSDDLKWVKVLPIVFLLMIFSCIRWVRGKNAIPVKYLSDPWEDSSNPPEDTELPLAVIDYATPEEPSTPGGPVRRIFAWVFSVAFIMLGGGIIVFCIIAAWVVFQESSRRDWPTDLACIIAFLLFGVAMLFSGIRWIRGKTRQPQLKSGKDE